MHPPRGALKIPLSPVVNPTLSMEQDSDHDRSLADPSIQSISKEGITDQVQN